MYQMFPNYKRHLPKSYIMGTLIRRREDPEYITEISDEVGTTCKAIGDATVEIMITTMGEIPDRMFNLETHYDEITMLPERQETMTECPKKEVAEVSGFVAHSTLFTVLLIALLLLLLICCMSACIIARARRKYAVSSDMECDPDCEGRLRQPLIRGNRMSDSTSKSSTSSRRR